MLVCNFLCDSPNKHTVLGRTTVQCSPFAHYDVIKWKHLPRYWPFVRGIHRSPVNSPHKRQCRGAVVFSLIWLWTNRWVNNRDAGDLRRHGAHYDVIVMTWKTSYQFWFEDFDYDIFFGYAMRCLRYYVSDKMSNCQWILISKHVCWTFDTNLDVGEAWWWGKGQTVRILALIFYDMIYQCIVFVVVGNELQNSLTHHSIIVTLKIIALNFCLNL